MEHNMKNKLFKLFSIPTYPSKILVYNIFILVLVCLRYGCFNLKNWFLKLSKIGQKEGKKFGVNFFSVFLYIILENCEASLFLLYKFRNKKKKSQILYPYSISLFPNCKSICRAQPGSYKQQSPLFYDRGILLADDGMFLKEKYSQHPLI